MKKKLLAILAIAVMVPLVFCACKKSQPEDVTEAAPQESVTQEADSEAPTDSEAPADSTAPTEDPVDAVIRLMEQVNVLKYVNGVSLDCDYDNVYYDEQGFTYTQVTDPDFQSIGDIWAYLFDTFTNIGALEVFPGLANMGQGESPAPYIIVQQDEDVPDGLYELQAGLGFSTYIITSDIEISDLTETSFTAAFEAEYYGQTSFVTLVVTAEDGTWKIDSITEEW